MFVCVLDVLSSVSRVAASDDKFRGPLLSVLRLKSNVGSPPPALRHPTLKNETFSIDWCLEAERVTHGSLRKLITDLSKGAIGRVPRGYKTNRVPEIPLSREDIVVHPAAREAFAYFQSQIGNRHVTPGQPQVAPPILEFCRAGDRRFLIGGFQQLVLLPDTGKLTCLVVERDMDRDADIEDHAWTQALSCESFKRSDNRTMATKFHALIRSLPERLVGRLLAKDPESARGTQLKTESLCRAFRLPSDSIRRHMPVAQRGGMETHAYTDHIVKKDSDDD